MAGESTDAREVNGQLKQRMLLSESHAEGRIWQDTDQ
jgi:hypothetical protein